MKNLAINTINFFYRTVVFAVTLVGYAIADLAILPARRAIENGFGSAKNILLTERHWNNSKPYNLYGYYADDAEITTKRKVAQEREAWKSSDSAVESITSTKESIIVPSRDKNKPNQTEEFVNLDGAFTSGYKEMIHHISRVPLFIATFPVLFVMLSGVNYFRNIASAPIDLVNNITRSAWPDYVQSVFGKKTGRPLVNSSTNRINYIRPSVPRGTRGGHGFETSELSNNILGSSLRGNIHNDQGVSNSTLANNGQNRQGPNTQRRVEEHLSL
jgi:hypothetical protein